MRDIIIEREDKPVVAKERNTRKGIIAEAPADTSMECQFFDLEGGEVSMTFTGKEFHEGHTGIFHGGATAYAIDDLMGRVIDRVLAGTDKTQVLSEMTVKYLKPVPIGKPFRGYGRVKRQEGRYWYIEAVIVDENQCAMVLGEGKYVEVYDKWDREEKKDER